MSRNVVIIGAGISGLATAALLARGGDTVTVIEKNPDVGGRAGLLERDGFRFDTGPSWYLMPEVFEHFFRMMGTSAEAELDLVRLDPGYRVFFGDGSKLDITADRDENLAAFERIEPGSAAKMTAYLDSARDTYEVAKRRFLYNPFTSARSLLAGEVVRRLPRLARLLGTSLGRHASRTVKDPRLQQVLGYPAVFLGSSPYEAPGMYHLMSHLDLDGGVWYPRGGLWSVIQAIERVARAAGVRILTGTEAISIETRDGGSAASGVLVVGKGGEPGVLRADVVIGACDVHHVETRLLPEAQRSFPETYWEGKTPGPGAVLLYLGVRGETPSLEHHNLLFVSGWRDNFERIVPPRGREAGETPDPTSLYVCRPSASDDVVAPDGHENLFVLVPVRADPDMSAEEVDRVGDRAIAQIAEWSGIPDLAERIVVREQRGPADFVDSVNSWSGSALGPAHVLSQSAMFRTPNRSAKVDGLYYAGGSTRPGIGLPMCLISAELIVKLLDGDSSAGPLPEPEQGA